MNSGGKKIVYSRTYVPHVMALSYTETKKYHDINDAYHKVNEAKVWIESIYGRCYWNDHTYI